MCPDRWSLLLVVALVGCGTPEPDVSSKGRVMPKNGAVWGRDALIPYALRAHYRHRRSYPVRLARYPVVRLRSQSEIDAFLSAAAP